MEVEQNTIDESVWRYFQNHLGYSDEEMALFRANPRNAEVVARGSEMARKTIIAEVVESHGCNSQHKVGDRFVFDGVGNLLTSKCPSRICFSPLHSLAAGIFSVGELIYAGVDPDSIRFNRVGCSDVGVRCGGWGHIVMEMRVVDRDAVQ